MIRRAGPADLDWLTGLEEHAFGPDAWSRTLVRAGLADTWVEEPVGLVVVTVAGEIADLQRIAVAAAARRTGLGRRLVATAVTTARGAGADRLLLEVREHNAAALALYADAGFAEIDRRRRYYPDGTDAVVLELGLYGR